MIRENLNKVKTKSILCDELLFIRIKLNKKSKHYFYSKDLFALSLKIVIA